MILITGATGQLGGEVIRHLLKKVPASQIAALVRDANKALDLKSKGIDIRIGDYDDLAALDQAMQGIDKVLLIAGTDEENRLQQHKNVMEAAKKAGVRCVAFTSRTLKDKGTLVNRLMDSYFDTEDYLKASGLDYAIFRNVLYMDTLPQFVGEKVFERGIYLPAGQGKVPFALRSEMGEGIANVLAAGDCGNRVYKFTGSEDYTFTDVAATLADLSGKEVNYTSPEKSDFEAQLKGRGLPDVMVERITGFITDIKNGQESDVSTDLENALGRKPASLVEGLKVLFKL
ncbi:SDR family oxidoreductase [Persicitalea jodogahamensis]|uniref:NAD(P)-dependent oxidoreductase n=1 Tax=Persicitalea jodogahamensis TaxID=402147 RepID=A0A8J3D789_9BACT|nr:SDR family oxidoreductase [Persicitalea jodogahamensis]GHB84025.1 NAD(P)-dependent oxidoreductase [Persicitalea jodogahamensis]